jgi:hypothetical protein
MYLPSSWSLHHVCGSVHGTSSCILEVHIIFVSVSMALSCIFHLLEVYIMFVAVSMALHHVFLKSMSCLWQSMALSCIFHLLEVHIMFVIVSMALHHVFLKSMSRLWQCPWHFMYLPCSWSPHHGWQCVWYVIFIFWSCWGFYTCTSYFHGLFISTSVSIVMNN